MNAINLDFTKKKKRNTAPISRSAVAKVVGGASKQGISREQGAYGVTQGNEGWRSQYAPQDRLGIRRNSIINSLTQSPSFKMPKIKHSLLTNEGFNEALGVVGARNRAKLDMQNRRVLSGVLGSLLSYDSRRHAADQRYRLGIMENETRKRGQDLSAKAKADALKETTAYHQILGNYYKGQNDIARERNKIAAHKAAAAGQPKQLNPLDAALKRQKLLDNNGYGDPVRVFGNEFNQLDENTQKDVVHRFIMDGAVPVGYEPIKEKGFFGGESVVGYTPIYQTNQQPQQGAQPTQQPQKQQTPTVNGKMLGELSARLKMPRESFRLSDDNSSVIFSDGSSMSAEELQKFLGS